MKKKEKGVWVTQAQVRLTGSPDAARFLAQCVYWSECKTVERRSGWFYKTRDEWKAETWLSRFKQEKARKKLKDLNILQERHERRNDGIRLWYRINLGLLNHLLNNLNPSLETSSNDMNVRSGLTGIKRNKCATSENVCTPSDTKYSDDSETAKNYFALMPVISTNVQTETEEHYSLNPQDYVFCHVFIYQFIKTRVHLLDATYRLVFQVYGLTHPMIADAFCQFVDDYGAMITDWYRQEVPKLSIPSLHQDDIRFAQIAGRRCYGSA